MARRGGWIAAWGLLLAHCSSTVDGTRATRDAAVEAEATNDAVAVDAATDAPTADAPVTVEAEPCDDARVVDLDRVGIATGLGLGAVVDLAAAPGALVHGEGDRCFAIYRPVVVRLRAPRDGRLFVVAPDQQTSHQAFTRRLDRCDGGDARLDCAQPVQHCVTGASCGMLFGDVRAGEPVDLAVGLAASGARVFGEVSRVAVTVAVLPSRPLGAPCGDGDDGGAAPCAGGLVCTAVGDPGFRRRCAVPPTLIPCTAEPDSCGAGRSCVGVACRARSPVGEPCDPARSAGCAGDGPCALVGDTFRCVAAGARGGSCRGDGCDPGLACDGSRCVDPVTRDGLCAHDVDCLPGHRCAEGTPRRCVGPGLAGGPCVPNGEARATCDAGLVCARDGAACVAALAEGDACRASRAVPAECGLGLLCDGARCARTGRPGDRCAPTGPQVDCGPGLACVAEICDASATYGRRCTSQSHCVAPYRCGASLRCLVVGESSAPCREVAPRCDEGLGCNGTTCIPTSRPGSPCTTPAECTDGLGCASREGEPATCLRPLRPCGPGCPAGETCRDDVCVVDGVCDRFGPSPQPCGEGRYCVRIGRAVTCARAGTAGATCRLDGATPCDDGLVCESDRCVPWLGEAAPCSRVPGGAGVCGAGLVCAPLGCVGPPSACAWQDAETDGRCRRHAPAGALDGDCTRGPDGRATCAAGLACDATFLYCRALAALGDPCDAGRVCADGTRCLYGVDPLRCVSAGGRAQPCRLDLARQCDPGLVCAAGRCNDAAAAGGDCARSRPCANGTECFARPDGTFACERVGVEGARCTGTSNPGCAPGLYCDGSTCVRALAAGEACSALGLPCADQLVCATESTSPRTCRPRGSAGSPCREVSECDDGLACNGACVPIRARSAACDPSGRGDACEGGYACVDGRCAAPTEGLPCAAGRCRDGLRCFGDTCRRPREPGEACAGSGGGAPCREDSACADGVCRVLGAAGAPCRRVRDAPACDGAMRCDLLADRCVP